MTHLEETLRSMTRITPIEGGFLVGTTSLLATGEVISLAVLGRDRECIVSDQGLAIRELEMSGAEIKDPSRLLRPYANRYGVLTENTDLFCRVPTIDVAAAILMVANACRDAFNEEVKKLKFTQRRDIRQALDQYLKVQVPNLTAHKQIITGTNKQHEFDHVFGNKESGKLIIVDPVLPEQTSINARVVAHLDVKKELGNRVDQYLIYDDLEFWTSDKLGLLGLASQSIVPFSAMDKSLLPMLEEYRSTVIH